MSILEVLQIKSAMKPKRDLLEGETLIHSARPSLFYYFRRIARPVLYLIGVSVLGHLLDQAIPYVSTGATILCIAIVALMAYRIVLVSTFHYFITDRRLITEKGIFRREFADIPYRSITNIAVRQDLADRLLGIGNVEIMTAGTPYAEEAFTGVDDYKGLSNLVLGMLRDFGAVER